MKEDTQVATKITSPLSECINSVTNMVTEDFGICGVQFDEYSKQCAMAAMTRIYQLVTDENYDVKKLKTSNLRQVVGCAASLKLNANAVPRECYFQLRNKKVGDDSWEKVVEMGIEGDGNDAILRSFGVDIDRVYPYWRVCEGDEFTYPKYRGVEVAPPEWEPRGMSDKVVRVVYPVALKDGTVTYLISERESVKVNLLAHVRNNLLNETFGICKKKYDATPEQKKQIAERKNTIIDALKACETLDDMLSCEAAIPYISAAWLDTSEEMIVRKMRNNAVRKFPKNFDSMANRSFAQMDDVYVQVQQDIVENANTVPFEPVAIEQAPLPRVTVSEIAARATTETAAKTARKKEPVPTTAKAEPAVETMAAEELPDFMRG